jgi:hypothetical protein
MNSGNVWDSYSHQWLYDRIHGNGGFFMPDGAGVSGAAGAQDGWAELAALMARACIRTEAALVKAGAVWEGGAADAMRSGVTPLAQWAVDARTASTASQSSTDSHVTSWAAAKNHMPEPVPVTSTANSEFGGIPAGFTHLFGGQTDQDKQEVAAQGAKAEAVRIMSGYEVESGAAQASVGRFVPPPSVAVAVSPSQPKGGDVIPVGVSEWPGGGRRIDDNIRSSGDIGEPGAGAPPPGGSGPGPGSISGSGGTTPGNVTTAGSTVPSAINPPTTGLVPDQQRPGSVPFLPGGMNTVGAPGERGAGGAGRGPVGRGFGEGGGRGPGSAGPGAGGARGAAPGIGGLASEPAAGRSGAVGARGANGMGMAPVGGRNDGEEDKEHFAAEYLQGTHDSFWDDSPPVAPAVIGDEDDD